MSLHLDFKVVVFSGSSKCFGILSSVVFLQIDFKTSWSCKYFGILVALQIGFKVGAFVAFDAVQILLEENFLEIFLLVSESFRVIFRYNTRPPCLCTEK